MMHCPLSLNLCKVFSFLRAAECFAQEFNRMMQPTRYRVSFLPVSVIMLSERKAQLCNVEPQMQVCKNLALTVLYVPDSLDGGTLLLT